MTDDGDYVVRPYDPGDVDDLVALHEVVWGERLDEEWVAYKYERNPYFDGPSLLVAETDGTVVGARPFIPFPVRVRSTDLTAHHLGNLMVHPDHRRRGLFTRMTTHVVREYLGDGATLTINFANDLSAPGYRKMGFTELGAGDAKGVRMQRPGAILRDRIGSPTLGRGVGYVADAVAGGYLSLAAAARPPTGRWSRDSIERRAGIPAETLATCYAVDHPETLHTRREAPLYRWLDANPHWRYETYLAREDGTVRAAVVVRETNDGGGPVWIVDAVPPASADTRRAFSTLLATVVDDYRDRPVLFVGGPVVHERLLPPSVRRGFGFHPSTRPPLDRVTEDVHTAFVYPVGEPPGPDLTVDGLDLRDPANWAVRVR